MKTLCSKTAFLFALLAFILGLPSLRAQENQSKATGKEMTVTGCLQKGDEAGEYSVKSEDGKLYGLRSKTVNLSKHVGHTVTVTGTTMREESEEKEKKEAGGGEYADLRVTNLKMISEGCK
ncbi:MAG TPA: hypothetical protein VKB40_11245 [Candidatus Acidoferrales bacterium]|nr:hypothetical protein [Candidatus Acidoferrales bacterium]